MPGPGSASRSPAAIGPGRSLSRIRDPGSSVPSATRAGPGPIGRPSDVIRKESEAPDVSGAGTSHERIDRGMVAHRGHRVRRETRPRPSLPYPGRGPHRSGRRANACRSRTHPLEPRCPAGVRAELFTTTTRGRTMRVGSRSPDRADRRGATPGRSRGRRPSRPCPHAAPPIKPLTPLATPSIPLSILQDASGLQFRRRTYRGLGPGIDPKSFPAFP
jgi:hypothetical protein